MKFYYFYHSEQGHDLGVYAAADESQAWDIVIDLSIDYVVHPEVIFYEEITEEDYNDFIED